jgi:hypothetical protein
MIKEMTTWQVPERLDSRELESPCYSCSSVVARSKEKTLNFEPPEDTYNSTLNFIKANEVLQLITFRAL